MIKNTVILATTRNFYLCRSIDIYSATLKSIKSPYSYRGPCHPRDDCPRERERERERKRERERERERDRERKTETEIKIQFLNLYFESLIIKINTIED